MTPPRPTARATTAAPNTDRAIYTTVEAKEATAKVSLTAFQPVVTPAGHETITTEIETLPKDYYDAKDYHQQYLSDPENPGGYCNHGPNGMTCPIGVAKSDA